MYDFILIQYLLGNLTLEQVFAFSPIYITNEQAEQITKENKLN